MSLKKRYFKSDVKFFSSAAIAIMIASAGLTGCQTGTVLNGGYVVDAESLNLVPEGSSRDLLAARALRDEVERLRIDDVAAVQHGAGLATCQSR